jgi:glycosyltransferase involved in cell wall biosynthesis
MIRVLLYGEIDLNLIDGSSIWLASLAELLSNSKTIDVGVLQRTHTERDVVIRQLKTRSNVKFFDPWDMAKGDRKFSRFLSQNRGPRLYPDTAVAMIEELDRREHYDVIIIRSMETAYTLSAFPQITRRMWVYMTDPMRHTSKSEKDKLKRIFQNCRRFLCQTEEAKTAFIQILEINRTNKISILPPMIATVSPQKRLRLNLPRLGYAGKFSPPYMIKEMLRAFGKIRQQIPNAEFHIIGDKFHNAPPVKNFVEDVTLQLQKTEGVIWHGGVSRDKANKIISDLHVATSWRDKSFDESLELSTKILEYSALGVPVLMNPRSVQYRIFGPGYPAYVESEQDFISIFIKLISSPQLYQELSKSIQEIAKQFTFENILNQLMPLLINEKSVAATKGPLKIIFAGHDFKFLQHIITHYQTHKGYHVLTDKFSGHSNHDQKRSQELLKQADIIFCEWCLGNAEWYSNNKRENQLLLIRLHHQELYQNLSYLDRIKWENVDCIIFICPNNMSLFLDKYPFMRDRSVLIFNLFDCDSFSLPKLYGAEFNLGFIGMAPKRKAPHLAFEILKRLKKIDTRYTLFIKGKTPWKYDWLWRRSDERKYYKQFYSDINESQYANSIVFDPHGNDMPEWFSKIGFLLSTSEHEGSHQAVAEAMASGAIPVIRNWAGADLLYPKKFVFESIDGAVELITKWKTPENYAPQREYVREYARHYFDRSVIIEQYRQLISGLLLKRGYFSQDDLSD